MTKRQKLESLLGRKVVLVKQTHTSIKKEDDSLVEKYNIRNKLIDVPGTICKVTGTYFEIYREEVTRCDYATKASKIQIFDKRGDKDGKIIPLKNITNSHLVNIIKHIERKAEEGVCVVSGYYGVDMMDMDFNEEVLYGQDALKRMNYDAYVNELKRRRND